MNYEIQGRFSNLSVIGKTTVTLLLVFLIKIDSLMILASSNKCNDM